MSSIVVTRLRRGGAAGRGRGRGLRRLRCASPDFARAALIAGGMIALAGCTAAAVSLFAARPVRHWLELPFGGIRPELSEVAAVLSNNLRLLAALFAAAVVGQLAVRVADVGRSMRVMARACDTIVLLGCANHVFVVGATVGAYGGRGVSAMLPHGPIELTAYSLALALYVAARRERLVAERVFITAGLSTVLLAISALVEVML